MKLSLDSDTLKGKKRHGTGEYFVYQGNIEKLIFSGTTPIFLVFLNLQMLGEVYK